MPRVSVIISSYNSEETISKLLDSVICMNAKDIEVCICDDCSTDNTVALINQYRASLKIRLVVNNENLGVSGSRLRAVALASARMLFFLDSDVVVDPDCLDQLFALMKATGADTVQGIYSKEALDNSFFSYYYAHFVNFSWLRIKGEFYPDILLNAFCSFCRKDVFLETNSNLSIAKGVEIENETMGRRISNRGNRIITTKKVQVKHHWGGFSKLWFIFTKRVYWWVKIFVASGFKFEKALTTPGYGFSAVAALLSFSFLVGSFLLENTSWQSVFVTVASGLFVLYVCFNLNFYKFLYRNKGILFAVLSFFSNFFFSVLTAVSAGSSCAEEILKIIFLRKTTIDKKVFL